jgi:hypothetical protein
LSKLGIQKAKSNLAFRAPVQRHGEPKFSPEEVALAGIDKEVLELSYVRL